MNVLDPVININWKTKPCMYLNLVFYLVWNKQSSSSITKTTAIWQAQKGCISRVSCLVNWFGELQSLDSHCTWNFLVASSLPSGVDRSGWTLSETWIGKTIHYQENLSTEGIWVPDSSEYRNFLFSLFRSLDETFFSVALDASKNLHYSNAFEYRLVCKSIHCVFAFVYFYSHLH